MHKYNFSAQKSVRKRVFLNSKKCGEDEGKGEMRRQYIVLWLPQFQVDIDMMNTDWTVRKSYDRAKYKKNKKNKK